MVAVTIKRTKITAETPKQLAQAVRAWIMANNYGASDVGGHWKVTGSKTVAALSYNGRLWDKNGHPVSH